MSENENADKQLLRDPSIQPTNDVLAAALGERYATYTQFLEMLADLDIELVWRYYKDGKAWLAKGLYRWKGLRGADKEKTIFWLSIWDGFFKLSFFFAEKARPGLQALAVGQNIKMMIESANQMGKLKFFPLTFDVRSDALPSDLGVVMNYQKGNSR